MVGLGIIPAKLTGPGCMDYTEIELSQAWNLGKYLFHSRPQTILLSYMFVGLLQ